MSDYLLRTISALIPKPDITVIAEQPWYSLSFAGTQVSFKLILSGKGHAANATKFERQLSEQEFDIPNQLVANIAVAERIAEENQTRLIIDALLLDD